MTRQNSITGVRYMDDPTIMAWDLANEPYVLGDDSGTILTVSLIRQWLEACELYYLPSTESALGR